MFSLNSVVSSDISLFNTFGLFFNDLFFFLFEIYFLFFLIFLLIFFVIIFNQKRKYQYYSSLNPLVNLSLFSLIISVLILLNNNFSFAIFNGFYCSDSFAVFFKFLIILGFVVFLPLLSTYISNVKNYDFEFFIVILLSIFSTVLLVNSNDLISFFFVIELQSLSFYILVSSKQVSSFSTEAGLKYFILGCFSSGLMLFGISLIYGFTGLLSFYDLEVFSSSILDLFVLNKLVFTGFVLGVFLVTIGLLFKFGASPFHMWMPDVYEGAPFIVTAYLSTLPKLALMLILLKLYYFVFYSLFFWLQLVFLISSVISIIWGSIAAIYQFKVKRLLTYSMITNTGYLFLAFSFFDFTGIYITIFYLLSYLFIMIGIFYTFISLRDRSTGFLLKKITYLSNLLETNPYLSFSIFIMLFSIAGIPPLLGFYSKMFLFYFTLKLNLFWVSIIFVVFSAVSVFYYIRLVKLMYFNRGVAKIFLFPISFTNATVISFLTFINCIFFINPNFFFKVIYNLTLYLYI